jgi:beta propeller repeat protein
MRRIKISLSIFLIIFASYSLINFNLFADAQYIGIESKISEEFSADRPDIFGDRVVWRENEGENYSIVLFNLSSEVRTVIITDNNIKGEPKIFGDYIVWHERCQLMSTYNITL